MEAAIAEAPPDQPLDQTIGEFVAATSEARAVEVERRCLAHFEERHPFRVWVARKTRGLLGIRGWPEGS